MKIVKLIKEIEKHLELFLNECNHYETLGENAINEIEIDFYEHCFSLYLEIENFTFKKEYEIYYEEELIIPLFLEVN